MLLIFFRDNDGKKIKQIVMVLTISVYICIFYYLKSSNELLYGCQLKYLLNICHILTRFVSPGLFCQIDRR